MLDQKVSIPIYDENNANLGILTIIAEIKDSKNTFSSFSKNDTLFENIPIVEIPDNQTSIQYYSGNDINLSNIMLLEETRYQVIFEASRKIKNNSNIELLPTLRRDQQSNFIFEPWKIPLSEKGKYKAGGNLNFHSYAGKSFFDIELNGIKSISYPFEVRSKKIGYYEQYPAMIGDLSKVASGILFEIDAPLSQEFKFSDRLKETYYEDFMFLEYLFLPENLPLAYEYILRNMYSRLEKYEEIVPATFASNIGPLEMIDIISRPDNLYKSKNPPYNWPIMMKNYVPDSIRQEFQQETIDIPENRLLKYFIELLDKLIFEMIENSDEKEGYIKDKLFKYRDIVQDYLSDRWTREVGKLQYIPLNSQVIQKREGYRDIFKYYINFEFAFRLEWKEMEENIRGYERKLSELYEYWCYFKLINVMSKISGKKVRYKDIYDINKDKWSIKVNKGVKSIQLFNFELDGHLLRVQLMYNRLFSQNTLNRAYSLPFKPDYTIQIDFNDKIYFVHFDAKYRSEGQVLDFYEKIGSQNIKMEEKEVETRDNEEQIYKKYKYGDLYKMHTYKDAILKTEGAYVLYPGDKQEIFKVEKDKPIPSVGAFPLTPGKNGIEEDELLLFIKTVLKNIIKRAD